MSLMRAMLCFRRGTNGPNLTDATHWLEPDRHRGLYFATVSPMTHYDARGARLIALTILLLSASGAVAQLPPPPIRVVPNLNPSSSLVLPGPARVAPTSTGARGCCYGTHQNRQHWLKKNHAHHGRRSHSVNTQEQIAEIQRRAAERAQFALESLFGETGGALRVSNRERSQRGHYDESDGASFRKLTDLSGSSRFQRQRVCAVAWSRTTIHTWEGRMTNVYIEARPKGRPEGSHIDDYVVEDHADHVLAPRG